MSTKLINGLNLVPQPKVENNQIGAGGWLTTRSSRKMALRDRVGFLINPYLPSPSIPGSRSNYSDQDRFLTNTELWQIYRRTPDVRAAVDSIVRRVATFDWTITPDVDPRSPEFDEANKLASRINTWLMAPNNNGDTWQEIWTAVLTDLLVYDASALELVRDTNGVVRELVPLKGSSIRPIMDEHGKLLFYEQDLYGDAGTSAILKARDENPTFPSEDIVFLRLFPTTATPLGNPLIEALVNEVITLLRSSEHTMMALDADEIPPGILVLAGVAGQAAREARADLMQMRGQDHKIRVLTTPDPQAVGARWVELRHTPKDLELNEIVKEVRRTCWRVFGVMPVEMGASDAMPRATAQVQLDVASSHLVTPVLELLQAKINRAIIPELLRTVDADPSQQYLISFKWDREARLSGEEAKANAIRLQTKIDAGVLTRNEARTELGLLPIVGGDVVTVRTPYGPIPLDAVLLGVNIPPDSPVGPSSNPGGGGSPVQTEDNLAAIDDVSKKVANNLREKAKEHNADVGSDKRKRTTANTLAKVFNRGVGAYHTNPESVRPSVTSPEQWAYGRVNSFLYALKNLKFRRGKHDTDLLPPSHPLHSKKENRARIGVSDLPLASLDEPWGWESGAQDEVLGDPPNWTRYGRAHLWKDDSNSDRKSGYKFPIARMIDGELKIVFRGVASVVGALKQDGKHESLSRVPVDEQVRIYNIIKQLYLDFDKEPPFIERLERAVGDTDPTNFPFDGDDLKVSLRNSNFEVFDPDFAEKLRLEYPEIWKKGGNILGNTQYRRLKPVVARGGVVETETEEKAVRLREAWSSRHFKDFRLAGVVAQIKWYTVGSRGEKYMKDLVREQMAKVDASRSQGRTMPEAWITGERFADVRTLDLPALSKAILSYTDDVSYMMQETEAQVIALFASSYSATGMTEESAFELKNRVRDAISDFAQRWAMSTKPYYDTANKIGERAASEFVGFKVNANQQRSALFHETAMGYLVTSNGLLSNIRDRLVAVIDAISISGRSDFETDGSSVKGTSAQIKLPKLKPGASVSEVLTAASAAFGANRSRVANWAGKLNELANESLAESLRSAPDSSNWWVEWISLFDERTCNTCAVEAEKGLQRLADLRHFPGGDTECRARCRCVLVYWPADEVNRM